jgi:hypothetical protein
MLSDIECGDEVGRRYGLLWSVSGDCVRIYLIFHFTFSIFFCLVPFVSHSSNSLRC